MKKIIIVIVVIILLVGGYFWVKGSYNTPTSNESDTQTNQGQGNTEALPSETTAPVQTHYIIYNNSGYVPKEITIKAGDMVSWKNQSSSGLWTASAMHPTHMIYDGTSMQEHCSGASNSVFDQCKSAKSWESWSFKFDKKGTWRYHNHVKSTDFGTIIVE